MLIGLIVVNILQYVHVPNLHINLYNLIYQLGNKKAWIEEKGMISAGVHSRETQSRLPRRTEGGHRVDSFP